MKRGLFDIYDGPPKGVRRKDWNNANFTVWIGNSLFILGIMTIVSGFAILKKFENHPEIFNVNEAIKYKGSAIFPVWITGRLKADDPVLMPDNGEQVIMGSLKFWLKGDGQKLKIFIDWKDKSKSIKLWDFEESEFITIPSDMIEEFVMTNDYSASGKLEYEGTARNKKIVGATYGKQRFSIDPNEWKGSIISKTERRLFNNNQIVVLEAGLKENGTILHPESGKLRIYKGTPDKVIKNQKRMNLMTNVMAILMIIGGGYLNRKGIKQRKELIKYSEANLQST
ncbi:MAG: hypothetical protein HQK76_17990 [Desulfobacterales bacterium]|nr:hypothetical protein [Desulfobacterales bacterium]